MSTILIWLRAGRSDRSTTRSGAPGCARHAAGGHAGPRRDGGRARRRGNRRALVPGSLLVAAPRLRWFHAWSAGVDWVLRQPGTIERDFVLTSSSGIHAIQMTEHVLALLLAFAAACPTRYTPVGAHLAAHGKQGALRLAGKTLLIVGLGGIGQRTARVAAALGMRVLGVRRTASQPRPGGRHVASIESLHNFLPERFRRLDDPLTPGSAA